MVVSSYLQPDGSTSYQIVSATPAELAAVLAAGSGAAAWVASTAYIPEAVEIP